MRAMWFFGPNLHCNTVFSWDKIPCMSEEIDKTDRRILAQLQLDAAMSMDELSERVGLSRNACWRRVRNLQESGVIRARVALVDPEAVNLGLLVFVLVRTHSHEAGWLRQFEQTVKSMPEIIGAHRMSGDLDYVLRVRVAGVRDYDHFYKRLIDQVSIGDISASFVMEDIKDDTALPV